MYDLITRLEDLQFLGRQERTMRVSQNYGLGVIRNSIIVKYIIGVYFGVPLFRETTKFKQERSTV